MPEQEPRFDQRITIRGATHDELFVLHELLERHCRDEGIRVEFEEPEAGEAGIIEL